MKSFQPFFLVGLLFIFFCNCERNRELKEKAIPVDKCENGNYDGDELGTDCGDNCSDCVNIEPDCSTNTNKARYYHSTGVNGYDTYQITDITCKTDPGGAFLFKGVFNGDTLKVSPNRMDMREEYEVHCNHTSKEFYGNVEYAGDASCGGAVYLGTENGKRYIEVCNVTFAQNVGYNTTYDTLQAKVLCP